MSLTALAVAVGMLLAAQACLGGSKLQTPGLKMTGQTSAKGTPVVDMWAAPMPDPDKPGAGFPILEQAEHAKVYHATKDRGGYSHHAQLIVLDGVFYAMWSNHPHGEDSPGQFVRFSISRDGENWSQPRPLFPPYGEIKPFRALGPFGTAQAGGWIVHEGKLYGMMGILDTVGYANTDRSSTRKKRDHEHKFRVKRFLGVVARSVELADGEPALGRPFELPHDQALGLDPDQPLTEALVPLGGERRETAEALIEARRARRPWRGLKAVDSPRPTEPTFYRAADGKWVCLMRDDAYSHRMYVSVSEDGNEWPPARPTNIPDSPSLSDTLSLPDGRVLLIGNQVAPAFDNWDAVSHYNRDPMTVAVSPDGYRFTRAYALRTGSPGHRVPGVGGRGRGAQYPSALVHDGRLHVLYSMGKEDIWISSVPIADIESDGDGG